MYRSYKNIELNFCVYTILFVRMCGSLLYTAIPETATVVLVNEQAPSNAHIFLYNRICFSGVCTAINT